MQLSQAASNQLREFLREEICADTCGPALIGAHYASLVAAKLASRFQLCVSVLKDQGSANVMKEAIGMARWLVRTSAKVKTQLANAEQELVVRQKAQEMLELILERGITKWRTISRRPHLQGRPFHQPTLDYLMATDQIIHHPEDSQESGMKS